MKKYTVAASVLALSLAISFPAVNVAEAGNNCNNISCDQPTSVGKGKKAPVWKVAYCVIGKPGNYTKVDCKSPEAVHRTPTGNLGVCFIGTDKKAHWDYQWVVHIGRPFKNRKIDGLYQPDWQR